MPTSIPPLVARGIDRAYGDRRILTGVDITVPPHARTGLIGENGVGKSTLLRILAGVEAPDAGTVERPRRTGILWQEAPVNERATIRELLDGYTAELRAIEREFQDAADALDDSPASKSRYERALEEAERAEVWTLDARREEILDGLGVSIRAFGATQPATISRLSGGQRSRVALAGLLLSRPDALLLDEPTNHLDDQAVAYLETQLKGWRGPVLFASHDRAFLDEVATELVDLDPDRSRTATRYGGTFSDYLDEKRRERERWEQQHRAEQDELARLSVVVNTTERDVAAGRGPTDNDKFVHAFKGSRVQSAVSRRVKDADRRRSLLESTAVRKPPPVLRFAGIPSGASALSDGPLIDATSVRVDGRLTLERLTIAADDRLLITGANGAGKSTLLSVLAGELSPTSGTVNRRRGLRVGLLRQDVRFADAEETPREIYRRSVGERRAEITSLGELGLVPPAQIDRPVGSLSVGQQRRLALAVVIANPPHLFLLDEPSNHLSLALAVELEEALQSYPGAVVVASHDRWLRRRWTGRAVRLGAKPR
ncbi:ABC-F family ATP-binding cassette domain-containing protein [Pseudolysinimonas sp.]|jgi:macrolide transport system ATP-binding/permease protein|uniref:ABC-F family ATP-binding cassette domain-containing protein n=1 Tax=Pseudolysinimonas sp. TaxID=2680009 RepID=UPI0037838149